MMRSRRLQSARGWLQTYKGKNVAAGYRKHFAVDWPCAFKELEMLGVKIDPEYKRTVLKSVEAQVLARQKKKNSPPEELFDQDENFAFIVGHTPAGFPYGLTWEEWKAIEE